MENQHNEIYSELRKMKAELEEKSKRKISNELINEFIQEEIQDIEYTLKKSKQASLENVKFPVN